MRESSRTFVGGYLRHIDIDDAVVVAVAVDDLLAPVTEKVGLQAGIVFRPVVRCWIAIALKRHRRPLERISTAGATASSSFLRLIGVAVRIVDRADVSEVVAFVGEEEFLDGVSRCGLVGRLGVAELPVYVDYCLPFSVLIRCSICRQSSAYPPQFPI